MRRALYGPKGFFSSGRGAGRARDFITSPEVGPLFGAVVARALDRWWLELGAPRPFVVIEYGSGSGALARAVVGAGPACAAAMQYVEIEQGVAPPGGPFGGVVLANELLDNLPFDLFERVGGYWNEVRVVAGGEVLAPASPDDAATLDRLAPDAPDGGRVPLQREAAQWVRDAVALVERGRVVAVDYVAKTADMAARPWPEWLRTYRSHGRGGHPLDAPGTQDITADVAVDQLPAPDVDRTQADFLRDNGIDDLVAEARAAWHAAAARPDLAALQERSRVNEAAALLDPAGLGGFRVLEWVVA